MTFTTDTTPQQLTRWLATEPTEDALRDAYLQLEERRAELWTPGHIQSFRRDRFDADARVVTCLVRLKWALAQRWEQSGQFAGLPA